MSQFRSGDHGWIRRKRGRADDSLVVAGEVDRVDSGPAALALALPEEHQNAAVGRPGGALVVEALGQDTLARTVRPHDADEESPCELLREGDVVAAGDQTGVE